MLDVCHALETWARQFFGWTPRLSWPKVATSVFKVPSDLIKTQMQKHK